MLIQYKISQDIFKIVFFTKANKFVKNTRNSYKSTTQSQGRHQPISTSIVSETIETGFRHYESPSFKSPATKPDHGQQLRGKQSNNVMLFSLKITPKQSCLWIMHVLAQDLSQVVAMTTKTSRSIQRFRVGDCEHLHGYRRALKLREFSKQVLNSNGCVHTMQGSSNNRPHTKRNFEFIVFLTLG